MPRLAYTYVDTEFDLRVVADLLREAPKLRVAVDCETTGLDPLARDSRLLLLQLGTEDGAIWVINAAKLGLEPLRGVLDNGRLCALQNAKFDWKWLKVHAGINLRNVYDTMLAELILIAGLYAVGERRGKASLKGMVERYTGKKLQKETRLTFVNHQGDEFTQEHLDYAAEDIPHLWTIKEAQTRALREGGLVETARLEFGVVPVVGEMELSGIAVDAAAYRKVIAESRMEMAKAERTCHQILLDAGAYKDLFGGCHVNLGSHDQVKDAFRDHFNVQVKSTDEKHLKKVDHPFARALLNYRDWETQVTSFGDKILARIHPVTGRLHPEFGQLGGDAGRFTCQNPNMQQIPADPKYRKLFHPRPGNVFVDADWQAMEVRVLAKVSGDKNLLDAFLKGRDLHSHTASVMYGLDYESVVKAHKAGSSPERKDAKILGLAMTYGMSIPSIAESLGCSVEEAETKQQVYFNAFPGVAAYLRLQDREGPRTLEVRSLGGRRRIFNPPKDRRELGAIQRQARNSPCQMGNADAMKKAMILLGERLGAAAIFPGIILTVHDELLVECPRDRSEETLGLVRGSMNEAAAFYLDPVPAVTEAKIVEYWAK